jgi:hypothetical protein
MLTRGPISHQYGPYSPTPTNIPGSIVDRPAGAFNSNKNIVAAMPIARPNSSPFSAEGAPFYMNGYDVPNGQIVRGGVTSLSPSRPKIEMDPSDPTTWQRTYRFT